MAAVTGLDPSVLVSPDYQVQMQRAQRQAALASALRSQSLQDTAGNGGSVSWTQGAARLAEALAANISNRRSEKTQMKANQAYASGMARMFGLGTPQTPQGAPPSPSGGPTPQMPSQAPQGAPAGPPVDPNAPPQAASPPPSAAQPAPMGGAPSSGPMNLTGDPRRDLGLYVANPEEYGKALIGNAAKGTAPTDMEVTLHHAQQAMAQGDLATATTLLQSIQKQNFIEPISGRPGGVILDAITKKPIFQTPKIGENQAVTFDEQGHPARVYNIPGALESAAEQAGAVAGGQAAAKAPYDVVQTYNPATGQMEMRPKSDVTGGGSLNQHYGIGGQGGQPGHFAAGPALGQQSAFETYGKGSANAFIETQGIANSSPQRVQSLREMQQLVAQGLTTGPTAARMQQLAEEHGLSFLAKDNAFVFNKDAARFVAQSAQDLGLNGSDQRLGMMANASPNMKMTPQALKTVVPTMIGLEYAKMAKASAAANWAQRDPGGNAKFETTWRQNYDPRMFTAYAQGGLNAWKTAPPDLRSKWHQEYLELKKMGIDFGAFAQ
jgi:hypothetical protein